MAKTRQTKNDIIEIIMSYPKYKNSKKSKLNSLRVADLKDILIKIDTEVYVDISEEEREKTLDDIFKKIKEIKELSNKIGIDNIFYNEQYKELEIARLLKHVHNEGQGSDAVFNNENCEYKSMNGERGSFQYHWLSESKMEKLRKTPHHYFCVYDDSGIFITKIYYISKDKIIPSLEESANLAKENLDIINKSSKKTKTKNTDAHKSFSLSKIIELGGELVYSV